MWSKLEEVFKEMGYPYARQGSFAEGETIPDSVFTFWNASTPEGAFYDDKANKAVWLWYVYFYTKQPELIYSAIDKFAELAKNKGFVVDGRANDIVSDEPNYFGRYLAIRWIEDYNS